MAAAKKAELTTFELALRPVTGKKQERYIAKMTLTKDEAESILDELPRYGCDVQNKVAELLAHTGVTRSFNANVTLALEGSTCEQAEDKIYRLLRKLMAENGEFISDFDLDEVYER